MRERRHGPKAVTSFDDTRPRHLLAVEVLRAEQDLARATGHRAIAAEESLEKAREAYRQAAEEAEHA
mgnify:CR=1 FL=1